MLGAGLIDEPTYLSEPPTSNWDSFHSMGLLPIWREHEMRYMRDALIRNV